jgi:hypothetical protein
VVASSIKVVAVAMKVCEAARDKERKEGQEHGLGKGQHPEGTQKKTPPKKQKTD